MYCDDRHEHMYVSIPQNANDPSFFNCFRCGSKGIVTDRILSEWNCYDDNIAIALINHNRNIKTIPKGNSRIINPIRYRWVSNDELSMNKLAYINNRLGVNLSLQDMPNLKICLNIRDFMIQNPTLKPTKNANDMNLLNNYFLGFISLDNYFINFRRLVDEGVIGNKYMDERYINYVVAEKMDNTERFYTIPTTIDYSNPNRIPIHIAEGPFDCLSIFLNVRKQSYGVYTSISGNKYASLVKHFIVNLGFHYSEIHLYPDNDASGSDNKMKPINDMCAPLGIPVYIHRNSFGNEKDFGVSPDRINENIYCL